MTPSRPPRTSTTDGGPLRGALPPTIVAEITKVWPLDEDGDPAAPATSSLLSARFEIVIEHNRARGYRLRDWRMTSVVVPGSREPGSCLYVPPQICETIVATFERTPPKRPA